MTIGAYDYDVTLGPNPDFLVFANNILSPFCEYIFLFYSETC